MSWRRRLSLTFKKRKGWGAELKYSENFILYNKFIIFWICPWTSPWPGFENHSRKSLCQWSSMKDIFRNITLSVLFTKQKWNAFDGDQVDPSLCLSPPISHPISVTKPLVEFLWNSVWELFEKVVDKAWFSWNSVS